MRDLRPARMCHQSGELAMPGATTCLGVPMAQRSRITKPTHRNMNPYLDLFHSCLDLAIQSLDSLNDQIVQFIFTPKVCDFDADADDDDCLQPKQREALKSSMALMRRLLLDAQGKFRKMVDDNKQLACRIDGDIQSAHEEVSVLRAELADTNRRISELSTCTPPALTDNGSPTPRCSRCLNCSHRDENQVADEVSELRSESDKLVQQNRSLQREVDELKRLKEHFLAEDNDQKPRIQKLESELQLAREALSALKADRKRLKAEKFDLLNQMKQLYGTLEDKERELRDFIRNYEQRMKESDESLKQARKQLSQLGYYSDQDSITSKANGFHTPTATTPVNLPNGRDHTPTSMGTPAMVSSTPGPHNGLGTPVDGTPPIIVDAIDSEGSPVYAGRAMSVCNESSPPPMMQGLSRSAEELTHMLSTLDLKKKGHRRNGSKGTWGSISRVFSRSRSRRSIDGGALFEEEKRTSWSPYTSLCASPLAEESYSEKLRLLEEAQGVPMERWRASTVLAWLELTLGMPQYASFCAENIKSGKILLELTDGELEAGLGISNPMHRRKLRLAIEEHRDPSSCQYPKIGELTHLWVCGEWLPGIGLSQYIDAFAAHLVDGRMLDRIGRKEMEKFLGVTRKFHQASILHGVHLLRMMEFDKHALADRRAQCENSDTDPIVWSNQRFVKWAKSIDLGEYAENLRDSGVHGALVVLEPSFSADTMAAALGIPQSKNIIRRHLMTELEALVQPARLALEQEQGKLNKRDKSIGSIGRNFSRSYAGGLHVAKSSDTRRSSLRGSLSRALGLKVKHDMNNTMSLPPPSPRSPQHHLKPSPSSIETHRRVLTSTGLSPVFE